MTAKEYFDEYFGEIETMDQETMDEISINLLLDMANEVNIIAIGRGVTEDDVLEGLIEVQNDKYNMLCDMFNEKYTEFTLKKDAFKTIVNKLMGIGKEEVVG